MPPCLLAAYNLVRVAAVARSIYLLRRHPLLLRVVFVVGGVGGHARRRSRIGRIIMNKEGRI